MLCRFDRLSRADGRWLKLWAAFDTTSAYLGTFTLDELRSKAGEDGAWITAHSYLLSLIHI